MTSASIGFMEAQTISGLQNFVLHIRQLSDGTTETCRKPIEEAKGATYVDFLAIIVLATMSGLFSGLNLGLLGLDVKNLELLSRPPFYNAQEEQDAEYAKKILPLRRKGNLLLCTILLGNVTVNSALAIFMGGLTSGLIGLIISTSIITLFGEIIPQAVCSRHALVVGAHTTWFVYFFMVITFPISYPISAILDKVLGEEVGNVISRNMMTNFFAQLEEQGVFNQDERKIMQAALDLEKKTAADIMTKIEDTYMLDINTKLDQETLREVYSKGFSRIPVYEGSKNNIIGILMSRDLILINAENYTISLKQLSSIIIRDTVSINETDRIEPLLGYFKKGLTHIGIVMNIPELKPGEKKDPSPKVIGIVTLEDIIEEIIQDEIEDENDENNDRNEKRQMQQKLVNLFMHHKAEEVLQNDEINAILQFLVTYVKAFNQRHIKRDILNVLIRRSTVLEIDGGNQAFSHISNSMINRTLKKPSNLQVMNGINLQSSQNEINESARPLVINSFNGIGIVDHNSIDVKTGMTRNANQDHNNPSAIMESVPMEDEYDDSKRFPGKIDYSKNDQPENYDSGMKEDNLAFDKIDSIIFRRGKKSDCFYLILSGQVSICSGSEGFMMEKGIFNFMGEQCITNQDYIPDFSAKVLGKTRLLKITKQEYNETKIKLQNVI